MNYGAKNYKQMQITTASPAQVLILLYEAAIKNVKKATEALEKKDFATKGLHIGKAHDIINELNTSLNHEVGQEIAKDLERLYNFMVSELLRANINNDPAPLQVVQKNLETLLDGWRGAVAQFQKDAASQRKPENG